MDVGAHTCVHPLPHTHVHTAAVMLLRSRSFGTEGPVGGVRNGDVFFLDCLDQALVCISFHTLAFSGEKRSVETTSWHLGIEGLAWPSQPGSMVAQLQETKPGLMIGMFLCWLSLQNYVLLICKTISWLIESQRTAIWGICCCQYWYLPGDL